MFVQEMLDKPRVIQEERGGGEPGGSDLGEYVWACGRIQQGLQGFPAKLMRVLAERRLHWQESSSNWDPASVPLEVISL